MFPRLLPAVLLLAWLVAGPARAASPARVRVAPDRRGFVAADGVPYRPLGVTWYQPGTGWAPQVWKRFDPARTRADFDLMQAAGVNCVRVFLTFASFCPEPGRLDPDALRKFDEFLKVAEEHGMRVHPTGPDHWEGLPGWASGDRIADEQVLAALEQFWSAFAARYRGRGGIFAYDLLNEPEVGWDTPALRAKWPAWLASAYGRPADLAREWGWRRVPDGFDAVPIPTNRAARLDPHLLAFQRFRESVADEWTRRQAEAIRRADPEALVTAGFVQWSVPASLVHPRHYAAFRPSRQAPYLDFLEVHFYPFDHGVYEYRDEESEERNLAYLESVVREAAGVGKPVVLAEFGWYGGGRPRFDGGRHPFAGEEEQARWCRHAVEATAGLACGWLNWGFRDQPEAGDASEFSGLYTQDGREKAWGREFRRIAGLLRAGPLPGPLPGDRPALPWDACVTDPAAGNEFRRAYAVPFRAAWARRPR